MLDRSTVLDGTLGPETLYVLFCTRPLDLAPVLRALEQRPGQVPDARDCQIERYTLLKVAR